MEIFVNQYHMKNNYFMNQHVDLIKTSYQVTNDYYINCCLEDNIVIAKINFRVNFYIEIYREMC